MILLGGIMVVTMDDIRKVLALFDDEDKPYILSGLLDAMLDSKDINKTSDHMNQPKVKTKVRGNKNDRI